MFRQRVTKSLARVLQCLSFASAVLGATQAVAMEDPIELVPFETVTYPGSLFSPPFLPSPEQGRAATIFGILRLPAGTDRVPAVVITHGCSGITGAEIFWGRHLRELGVATLTVNSNAGRDIPRFCSGRNTMSPASLVTDVYRARDLLAAHPRIDAARIAVMGFSVGGRTALWAGRPRFQQRYGDGSSRFAAHLAFYPVSCNMALVDEEEPGDVPIRIFQGAADELIALERCRDRAARLRAAGKDVALFEYAGAKHWFENADLAARPLMFDVVNFSRCDFVERDERIVDAATGAPADMNAPCIVAKGTFGYHPVAHQQAVADVRGFLSEVFRLR